MSTQSAATRSRSGVGTGHDVREVTILLMGPFTVLAGAEPARPVVIGSRKARSLLARLAAAHGGTVGVEQIVDALWPDVRPRHPDDNVATLVSRLRAAPGPEAVLGSRAGYRLGPVTVDLDRRRRWRPNPAIAWAGVRRHSPPPPRAGAWSCSATVGCWSANRAQDGWTTSPPRRPRGAPGAAPPARRGGPAAGDPRTGLAAAQAATDADPLDERAHHLLMQACVAVGEPRRALATFERLRAALAAELGADPSLQTRELHVAILRDRTGPTPPVRPVLVARGAPAPAGRDEELAELTAAWSAAAAGRPALWTISGEAGIGKTTLARALARTAQDTGGLVLEARCYAECRRWRRRPAPTRDYSEDAALTAAGSGGCSARATAPQCRSGPSLPSVGNRASGPSPASDHPIRQGVPTMIDVMSELGTVKAKTAAALSAAEADGGASVVLVAVVREFDTKAGKANRAGDTNGSARDSVIELEQAGDSAKAAAEADTGLGEKALSAVQDAHLAICILKTKV